jgi:3-isopropylmalate/(R)-2-methylmalate dehydratase small subunit
MTPFLTLDSKVVALAIDDIDTDQIIPARFLKGTSKTGLAAHLFADWRARPDFPLTSSAAQVLVTGENFGCGSSREHAVWALTDWGFRAIIARSFADIFRENATKNGLVTIELGAAECAQVERAGSVNVDLLAQRVSLPDGKAFPFAVDAFAKHCLTNGLDELGYILSFSDRIGDHERQS